MKDSWFDDEAWDEDRWEAFLRENDRRVDRYMELLFHFMRKHPIPGPGDGAGMDAWKDALRTFLQDRGWQRDDLLLPFLWLDDAGDDAEEADEAPATDALALFRDADDVYDDAPLEDVRLLPVYRQAHQLTVDVLDWAHALSDDAKDSTLVHFCSHVTAIPGHVARGHGIGAEHDALGGYIACVKRGLSEANAALDLLRHMKPASYMEAHTYRLLYERTYEVRNALGLFVQDLRDRFDLGVD